MGVRSPAVDRDIRAQGPFRQRESRPKDAPIKLSAKSGGRLRAMPRALPN